MALPNNIGDETNKVLAAQAHIANHVFNYINSMSLKCAIQLGIPDIIHNHGRAMTQSDLVNALPINKSKGHDCIYRLMRILIHAGFFTQGEEGYLLTPTSRLLLKNEPLSLAPFVQAQLDPVLMDPWHSLGEWFVNEDSTPFATAHGKPLFEYAGDEQRLNNLFNEAMGCDARLIMSVLIKNGKGVFEGLKSLVDVGGGIGTVAKAISNAFPELKCSVFDLPHVVEGLEGGKNLTYIAGDMFKFVPSADAILLKIGSDGRTQNSNNRNTSDGGVGASGDEVKITQPPPLPVEVEGPNRTESVSEYYSFRTLGNSFATNQQGWPSWLVAVAGDAIKDWTPRRADTFQKIEKIGQGTYSNVYKAKDLITGKIVALKKVRFDTMEPESVKFMAREILVLKKLDHPNVIKLEGLVTSRMSSSLYLVFEYMEHDLAGLAAVQKVKFSESQVKCYMKQLLSGLEHCHNNGVLHRDVKGSNLLIDNEGILKIADFGLASFYDPEHQQPMTSRVVTLWYRPPELLLGATNYGVGVDLWSAGCILAELLARKPIFPGRTEVEQLHKIFRLCGSPSEEYWKKFKLPNATLFKPQQPYKRCIDETFKDFPPSSHPMIATLLAIDPDERGTATAALNSEFLTTEPYPCEPSSLPKYPPSKEMDVKLRDEAARRQSGLHGKVHTGDGVKKVRRERVSRAIPAPEANAELQPNLDRWRMMTQANAKSKSEKFPPPHQDGAVGYPLNASHNGPASFSIAAASFDSSFDPKSRSLRSTITTGGTSRQRRTKKEEPHMAPSRKLFHAFLPSSFRLSIDMRLRGRASVSETFSHHR